MSQPAPGSGRRSFVETGRCSDPASPPRRQYDDIVDHPPVLWNEYGERRRTLQPHRGEPDNATGLGQQNRGALRGHELVEASLRSRSLRGSPKQPRQLLTMQRIEPIEQRTCRLIVGRRGGSNSAIFRHGPTNDAALHPRGQDEDICLIYGSGSCPDPRRTPPRELRDAARTRVESHPRGTAAALRGKISNECGVAADR